MPNFNIISDLNKLDKSMKTNNPVAVKERLNPFKELMKGNDIDFSDYKQMAEDCWLFLTTDKLPNKATVKREAFLHEVGAMIQTAILYAKQGVKKSVTEDEKIQAAKDVVDNSVLWGKSIEGRFEMASLFLKNEAIHMELDKLPQAIKNAEKLSNTKQAQFHEKIVANFKKWIIEFKEASDFLSTYQLVKIGEIKPIGEVLLLTNSKTFIIGDWYNGAWRTHRSQWQEINSKNELISAFKDEEITHYVPLPKIL